MTRLAHVQQLLDQLRQCLEESALNQQQKPCALQMVSTMPFCYDTMVFEQWLEFVFIPRLQAMLSQGQLPDNMQLLPMLELRRQARQEVWVLAEVIRQFDESFRC